MMVHRARRGRLPGVQTTTVGEESCGAGHPRGPHRQRGFAVVQVLGRVGPMQAIREELHLERVSGWKVTAIAP